MGLPDLAGYNDHQLAALIVIAVIVNMAGIALLILKIHSTGRDAKAANEQTVNTGNGFAKSVKDSLAEIKESNARLERRLDEHMNNHDRRNNA